jgi:DNA-binding IclR family transcriptional regulator
VNERDRCLVAVAAQEEPAMRIVPALDRGLRILSLLAARKTPMRVSEIAQALQLPRSATYELINTLAAHQMIHQNAMGEVSLGPQTLAIGSAYGARLDFAALARDTVHRVMMQCEETAQIGVLDGRDVLYVAKADSPHAVRLASTVGARLPAHCTALGKILLALLPEAELERRLGSAPLERLTERSITSRSELVEHLREARVRRFAWEECESNAHVACVAAPIVDAHHEPIAALSIATPLSRMNAQRRHHLRAIVVENADMLSKQLGAAVMTMPATGALQG